MQATAAVTNHFRHYKCGLRRKDRLLDMSPAPPIPLTHVHIAAQICDANAAVIYTQRYKNTEENPIEATFVFPLDSAAAVAAFEVEIDGERVKGQVKEKEEAKDIYDDAIAEGRGGYLLEQKKGDVFKMNVGNLPPGKECSVKITLISQLVTEGSHIRFTLPASIEPRYAGQGLSQQEADAAREIAAHSSASLSSASPVSVQIEVDVKTASDIQVLSSPSHPIQLELNHSKARVTLAADDDAPLTKDFVLLVKTLEPFQPRVWIDSNINTPATKAVEGKDKDKEEEETKPTLNAATTEALMLTFTPKFGPLLNNQQHQHDAAAQTNCEFIFLVDRSGSMSGSGINQARAALQLFLKSLPEHCTFNIVSFGSRHSSLFEKSMPYDDDSLDNATRHVSEMQANMGGTELLAPLESILMQPLDAHYASRQVFVLTDGEVSNTDAVVNIVDMFINMKMPPRVTDCLDQKICTYTATAKKYEYQTWYHCRTCYPNDNLSGFCLACKEACHSGHDVEKHPRFSHFFCDCGSNSRRCKCLKPPRAGEERLIETPKRNDVRVFTIGLGASASAELVSNVARVGNGIAEFVVEGERLETKVMRLLALAVEPSAQNAIVDWGSWTPFIEQQSPVKLPPVFNGQPLNVYALLKTTADADSAALPWDQPITLKMQVMPDKEEVVYTLSASDMHNAPVVNNSQDSSCYIVRTLAAKHAIKDLEDLHRAIQTKSHQWVRTDEHEKERLKQQIIRLSLKYQLASTFTAFIATDNRTEATEGTMQARIVPLNATVAPTPSVPGAALHYSAVNSASSMHYGQTRHRVMATTSGGFGGGGGRGGGRGGRGGGRGGAVVHQATKKRKASVDRDRERSKESCMPPAMADDDEDDMAEECEDEYTTENAGPWEAVQSARKRARSSAPEIGLAQQQQRQQAKQQQTPHEQLGKLVAEQRANGSFKFSSNLASAIGRTFTELQAFVNQHAIGSSAVSSNDAGVIWATVLALLYLEKRLTDLRADWQMLADKARRWLNGQATRLVDSQAADVTINQWTRQAAAF